MQKIDDKCALTKWCEALLKDEKYVQAERFARILHEDDAVKSLITLSNVLDRKDEILSALELIEDYLNKHSDLSNDEKRIIYAQKGKLLARNGKDYPSLTALRHAKELTGGASLKVKNKLDFEIASLLAKLSDFEAAQTLFNKGLDVEYGNERTLNSRIVQLTLPLDKNANHIKPSEFNFVKILDEDVKAQCDYVYFVSGDLHYCRFFAAKLAQQLANLTDGNVRLHLHGIITGDDDPGHPVSAWSEIKRSLASINLPVTFTSLNLDLSGVSKVERQFIYVCERFRILPKVMADYDCPVVVAHLDQLPLFNPSHLLSGEFDVGLMLDPCSVLDMTSSVHSELLVFGVSDEAMKFANCLSVYFDNALANRKQLSWGLDRAGLAVTRYQNPWARVKNLSIDIIETKLENQHPSIAYKGKSTFIGRCDNQSPQEFANFLTLHKGDFSPLALARSMGMNGHEQEGIAVIEQYLTQNPKISRPEKFEIHHLKGLIHAQAGNLELCHNNFTAAQKALPKGNAHNWARSFSLYQLGSVSAALGYLSEAQEMFDLKIDIECGNGWFTDTGIVDFKPYESQVSPANSKILYDNKMEDASRCTYFVAANLQYCQQFVPALIAQFEKLKASDVHLHIHGIASHEQASHDEFDNWGHIKRILRDAEVSTILTIEPLPIDSLNVQQLRSAYASERFRLLPSLLEQYKRPIVVADIDQLPLRNPASILEENCDAQFLYSPKSVLNFLSVVSATVSTYYPTPTGFKIAKTLSAYIERAYAFPEKLNWHVDQAALAVVHCLFDDGHIAHLNPEIVEDNAKLITPSDAFEAGRIFWSVTNSIQGNSSALVRLQRENDFLKA